jgi:hypothetical protein
VLSDHRLRQQVEHPVGAAGLATAEAGGVERPQVALGGQPHHGEVRRGRREARRVHGRAGADGPRAGISRAEDERVRLG